jgi:hypothetical protein
MHGAFLQGSVVAITSIMSNINYYISVAQVKNMGKPTLISVRTLMNGPRILSCTAVGGITAFLFNYMDIYDTYRVQANIDINIKRYRL